MRGLRLDKIEVCSSFISQKCYRAAFCDILIKVTPGNKNKALKEFKRTGETGMYSGLSICGVDDLSFLKEFPLLLYLEISNRKPVNSRYLDSLGNLRGLYIAESPGAGIDFECFPYLEFYIGEWHADNRNLSCCKELRRLRIRKFNPRTRDLTDMVGLTRLEDLEITQSNITSLSGLETLEDLRYLDIAYAPKLESLNAFKLCGTNLRELFLQNTKKIRPYEALGTLSHLRRLKMFGCAAMSNLKWVSGLKFLDAILFVDTNVKDGDLSPLLKLPKLRCVGTLDKRHYNYTCDALNEILNRR